MPTVKNVKLDKSQYIRKIFFHKKYEEWVFCNSTEIRDAIKEQFDVVISAALIRGYIIEHKMRGISKYKPTSKQKVYYGLDKNIKELKRRIEGNA